MLLIPLVACIASYVSLENLTPYEVPPQGKAYLVIKREYYDESLGRVESCWVERASGSGLRRCITRLPNLPIRPSSTFEGFANGLELPDRIVETHTLPDSIRKMGYILRRESIPSGNHWVTDSLPGCEIPWLRNDPDSVISRHDSLGRIVEHRSYSRGRFSVQHTQWGPWGPIMESDSSGSVDSHNCTQATLDSTRWIAGQIAHKIRYVFYGSTFPASRDSTAWEGGRKRFWARFEPYRSPLDTPSCTTRYHEDSLGDTIGIETCGGITVENRYSPGSSPLVHSRGDTIIVDHEMDGGTRYEYLDSAVWGHPRFLQMAIYDCHEGLCKDESRIEYEYATLDASTGIARTPDTPAIAIRQDGHTLRWTGTVPDGATVQLYSLDGHLLGSAHFQDGSAMIGRTPAAGFVFWSVEEDGKRLGSGNLLTR